MTAFWKVTELQECQNLCDHSVTKFSVDPNRICCAFETFALMKLIFVGVPWLFKEDDLTSVIFWNVIAGLHLHVFF